MKTSLICFELSMPHESSWNGRWSGEGLYYAKVRSVDKTNPYLSFDGTSKEYRYRWDDGWEARITARSITSKEAAKIRRRTVGFCGYDWMIDEIISKGRIVNE